MYGVLYCYRRGLKVGVLSGPGYCTHYKVKNDRRHGGRRRGGEGGAAQSVDRGAESIYGNEEEQEGNDLRRSEMKHDKKQLCLVSIKIISFTTKHSLYI